MCYTNTINGGVNMHIAILDDEEIYHKIIKDILIKYDVKNKVSCFKDAKALLQENTSFDLLLLDIEMQGVNGIDFARENNEHFPFVMFVTNHEDYVLDAFNTNVCGYILKKRLQETLIKKIEDFQQHMRDTIFLQTDYGKQCFRLNTILYFVFCDTDIRIQLNHHSVILKERSLRIIKDKCNDKPFVLANRKYLVNVKHVVKLLKTHHEIVMSDGMRIEVSRRNWSSIMQAYLRAFTS